MADDSTETPAVKAVKATMRELHPDPLPSPHAEALRKPLDLSDKSTTRASRKVADQMSDNGGYANGQYRALQTDVDNLKTNFHDLRADIDARFSTLSGEVRDISREIGNRFDRMVELQSSNRPDTMRTLSVAGGIATVLLVIIGGFASLAKTNLDTNIQFTNEKIGTQAGIVRDDFSTTNATIGEVAAAVKNVVATTIPRPELEYRINGNRDSIHELNATQDRHSTQLAAVVSDAANLKADVERLKGEIVTRRENEGHWDDYQNRINLLSNRVTDLAKANTGLDVGGELRQLQNQFSAFQQKFVAVPSFPKYVDPDK